MRDFNSESRALETKKYDYRFDEIVRSFMMRAFSPFFRGGSALELGCHHGESTILLADKYEDLTVVEASSEALEVASRVVPKYVKLTNSTIEECDFDRCFDAIFLINTLEHVEDSVFVLQKIRSWLAPNGQFFVLVPNADAPSRQIAVHMGLIKTNNSVTDGEWAHGHRRTYSFDTLESDLKLGGFTVRQRGGLMFKALANFQFDKAYENGIIDEAYFEGIYRLGTLYPNLCASIYAIATSESNLDL